MKGYNAKIFAITAFEAIEQSYVLTC